jgi:hypothetical protein
VRPGNPIASIEPSEARRKNRAAALLFIRMYARKESNARTAASRNADGGALTGRMMLLKSIRLAAASNANLSTSPQERVESGDVESCSLNANLRAISETGTDSRMR